MIIVIIAGGSGTRLWPLSTHNFPKHLLKLTNEKSLLQNTYERVKDLSENIFVIPEKTHAKHVYSQLPGLPRKNILVEPARRGTASCFILALSEIRRRKLPSQAILFLWADHLIKDKKGFAKTAQQAATLAEKERKLVFTGVKPTYPSTGLGYMKKGKSLGKSNKYAFELKHFVEKPDRKTAQHYLKSKQYLWNTGYLTGTIESFEKAIRDHSPRLWNDYIDLSDAMLALRRRRLYMEFVSEPIDTALSEHVPDALVVQGNYDWLDVGSFQDLHRASLQDKNGNYVNGQNVELENVSNSYVRNEDGLPVAIIGLENIAVVVNDNGVLITNKDHAQKVGDLSKKLQQTNKKAIRWLEKL